VLNLTLGINQFWISQLLGSDGLAVAGSINAFISFSGSALFGLAVAAGVFMAREWGAGNRQQWQQCAFVGGILSLAAAVILASACASGSTFILAALRTPSETMSDARSYLYSMLGAFPALTLSVYLQGTCRSVGDSAGPLVSGAVGCALAAALDPILIHFAPSIGLPAIAGAGIGTAISSLVAILLLLKRLPAPLWALPDQVSLLRLTAGICKFALPISLQLLALGASSVVLFAVVNSVGTNAAAAFSATALIWTYINLPLFELGSTFTTVVAQNHDRLDFSRFLQLLKLSFSLALLVSLPILVLATFLVPYALEWLLRTSPEVGALAATVNEVYLLAIIPTALAAVVTGVLRARGYVWSLFLQQMIVAFAIQIPVAIYLWPATDSRGIWLSIVAYAAAWLIGVGIILAKDLRLMAYRRT
jgi:Na+-driven multidrug efflux pump